MHRIVHLIVSKLISPDRCDLFHYFAIAIPAICGQPVGQLSKIKLIVHHKFHRELKTVITFNFEKFVFNMIEQQADRLLARR